MTANVATRIGGPEDSAFILATWLKGYRYGSSYGRAQRNGIFFPAHHVVLTEILGRTGTRITLAHVPDDPNLLVGFLVHEVPNVVHWLFVKEAFRRHGIARSLLEAADLPRDLAGVELSHVSDAYFAFGKARCPGAVYCHYRQFWQAGVRLAPARNGSRELDPRQTA